MPHELPGRPYTLYCQTALHAGAGAVLSHVDLPIQRETQTQHPIVYASGVKGALREHFRSETWATALFGSEPGPGETSAGAGIFQEARVLLFPVRSFTGVFVWATCPLVIERARFHWQGTRVEPPAVSFAEPGENTAYFDDSVAQDGILYLEDYDFTLPSASPEKLQSARQEFGTFAKTLADLVVPVPVYGPFWNKAVADRLVVVSDSCFAMLTLLHAQIETHVHIGENGTVAQGPWVQESLPAETVLYTVIRVARQLAGGAVVNEMDFARKLHSGTFLLGGDRSLGKGWVKAAAIGGLSE